MSSPVPNKVWGKYSLTAALLVMVALGSSGQSSSPQSSSTAEHTFKNIQVLKEIPANQLIPSMQFISASLGVECGFCHVENHFDQDEKKPKLTARKMMLMMAAINQNSFEGHRQVTCNTCHRGARVPQGIPSIDEGPFVPKMRDSADDSLTNLPSAAQLLDKYVAALGGEKALSRVSTLSEKGTANFMGREIPIDIYDKAPNKRASYMHLPNGDSVTVFNGQQGWTGFPHQPPREMPLSELEGAKIDADLQFAVHIRQMFPNLRPARPESIAGHETYQLVSENSDQPHIRLYFDQHTGLLLRMVRYGDSPLGLNPVRVDYADYRPVDSVQVPHRWTVARPQGQFTVQVSEVTQNVDIDDAKFAKPAARPQSESSP